MLAPSSVVPVSLERLPNVAEPPTLETCPPPPPRLCAIRIGANDRPVCRSALLVSCRSPPRWLPLAVCEPSCARPVIWSTLPPPPPMLCTTSAGESIPSVIRVAELVSAIALASPLASLLPSVAVL